MRLRHRFALLLTVLLVGVLLPVVEGVLVGQPPVAAAPGSAEALVDSDGDPATPPVREFAGATRYETSLAAAQRYVSNARSAGVVPDTVIVASGESLIDAAAAAGLARAAGAPVLLTPSEQLFIPAAYFIERERISRVIITGGPNAVSPQVEAALRGVPGVAVVERIGGADRFETASLVGAMARERAGSLGTYCGSPAAAVLVAGDGESFADITVAGPLSYSQRLPILLSQTQPDKPAVPAATAAALGTLGVRHVVIVGGSSQLVQRLRVELSELGVAEVTHLGGANEYDTSVQVLKLLQDCRGSGFSSTSVALISSTALPDGISAAPLLGQGLSGDGTTPVLLVSSNSLPSEARSYLAETETAIEITVIGGTNAIRASVADAAAEAANTEPRTREPREPRGSRGGGGGGGGGSSSGGGQRSTTTTPTTTTTTTPPTTTTSVPPTTTTTTSSTTTTSVPPTTTTTTSSTTTTTPTTTTTTTTTVPPTTTTTTTTTTTVPPTTTTTTSSTTTTTPPTTTTTTTSVPPTTTTTTSSTTTTTPTTTTTTVPPTTTTTTTTTTTVPPTTTTTTSSTTTTTPPTTTTTTTSVPPTTTTTTPPPGKKLSFTRAPTVILPGGADCQSGHRVWLTADQGRATLTATVDNPNLGSIELRDPIEIMYLETRIYTYTFVFKGLKKGKTEVTFTAVPESGSGYELTSFSIPVNVRCVAPVVDDTFDLSAFPPGDPAACRIKRPHKGALSKSVAFPLGGFTPGSVGTYKVAVLFVDFPDFSADREPEEEENGNLAEVEAYLEAQSYGRLDVEFVPHYEWIRLGNPVKHYISNGKLNPHLIPRETVQLAMKDFDFRQNFDSVMIILRGDDYFSGGFAGLLETTGLDFEREGLGLNYIGVTAVGIPRIARNNNLTDYWNVVAHENLHVLGLPDLYPYDSKIKDFKPFSNTPSPESNGYPRTWVTVDFGLMGVQANLAIHTDDERFTIKYVDPPDAVVDPEADLIFGYRASEMLAWSRWLLDWLPTNQVECLTEYEFETEVTLSPIASPSGVGMISIPLSRTSTIALEARRVQGYDLPLTSTADWVQGAENCGSKGCEFEIPSLAQEGVLAYRVDSNYGHGEVPIRFLNHIEQTSGQFTVDVKSYPVIPLGEAISYQADDGSTIEIEVVESDDASGAFVVRVARSSG